MQAGFLEVPGKGIHGRSSDGVGEGHGSGETDKSCPLNQPLPATNIGRVLMVKSEMRLNGKDHAEFKRGGNPQGSLAESPDESILAPFRGGSVLPFGKHGFGFPRKLT
jgi:hypothetical protein